MPHTARVADVVDVPLTNVVRERDERGLWDLEQEGAQRYRRPELRDRRERAPPILRPLEGDSWLRDGPSDDELDITLVLVVRGNVHVEHRNRSPRELGEVDRPIASGRRGR